ncbi:MAG: GAF domain-containing protein, partial [Chloroflexota bacterium]
MISDSVLQVVQDFERLSTLQKLELLDTSPEETFDRLTRLASKITNSPISLVSLVDRDRQFFKSLFGLPEPLATIRETPLSHSFCKHVVATGEPLIVSDAREDPVLKDNLAIPDFGVIAYLGMPLTTIDGTELGSFCIIDDKPRVWTDQEIEIIRELAESVMTEIELRLQIKAREQVETSLKDTQKDLQTILDHIPAVMFVLNRDGDFTLAKGKGLNQLGFQEGEAVGQSLYDIYSRKQIVLDNFQAALAGEAGVFTAELSDLFFETSFEPLRDEASEVTGVVGVALDITDRVKAEEALQHSEKDLRQVISSVSDHIYTIQLAKDTTAISNASTSTNLETITGYPMSAFLGDAQFWPSLIHPDDKANALSQIDRFIQGDDSEVEYRIKHANGDTIWVRDSGRPEVDDTDGITRVYGVISDITSRKQAEAALIRQEARLHSLYEAATLSTANPDSQFRAVLEVGVKLLDLELGIISQVEGDTYTVLYFHPSNPIIEENRVFPLGKTYCDITFNAYDIVKIDHMQKSTYHNHPCYKAFALEAYIGAPIWVGMRRFGTLNFSSTKPRETPFTQADVDFVNLMSQLVSTTFERVQDRKALAQARDEAIEANRFKTQLLAKVSHELRTPLGAILGYTEILQAEIFDPVTSQQGTYLSRVLDSTHYLTDLVGELLDQAQIDAGQLVLVNRGFSPQGLLKEIEDKTKVLVEQIIDLRNTLCYLGVHL